MFRSVISISSDNSIVGILKISLYASRKELWRSLPRLTVKDQRRDQKKEIANRNSVSFDSEDKIRDLLLSLYEHDHIIRLFILLEINSR